MPHGPARGAVALAAGVGALLVVRSARLTRRLRRDPKCGVLTCAAWQDAAGRRLAHAVRDSRPAAVLMIDVDDFKSVNDHGGHLAGDAVLGAVAACLRSCVRATDLVGRFGGDEFAVLLESADQTAADRTAHRVAAAVASRCPVTVCIGAAAAPDDGTDLPTLLECADARLYAAKRRQVTAR